jgi:DNA-binding NarL/FixJ family response regulator
MTSPFAKNRLVKRTEDKVYPESTETGIKAPSKQPALKKNAFIRIILVDDHLMMRQGLRTIVMAYDHFDVVGEAGDGAEAVELARLLDPDVVVMDINMPEMDGIEATRQIKAKQPTTVIIGLSVNQSADPEQKMKAAGAFTYLTKEERG